MLGSSLLPRLVTVEPTLEKREKEEQ